MDTNFKSLLVVVARHAIPLVRSLVFCCRATALLAAIPHQPLPTTTDLFLFSNGLLNLGILREFSRTLRFCPMICAEHESFLYATPV